MDIRVVGKNIAVTEGMKEHLRDKLVKFEKYAPRLIESHVVLKKEKYLFVAEITLLARNLRAYGEASSKENIFAAMDGAYVRVEKQLKKFREKIKDHHRSSAGKIAATIPVKGGSEPDDEPPQIVRARASVAPKPMFPEDAAVQLRDSNKPFLVFHNASTQKVNVLFKREDGNFGLIEPGF
jgi:putative sigma-54 modulation protein